MRQVELKRKIGATDSSQSGTSFSNKNNNWVFFESIIERDFIDILEMDTNVWTYTWQPISIDFYYKRKIHTYTPDVLIKFRSDQESTKNLKPILCEINYRKELKKNWVAFHPKFSAAMKVADTEGWRFKIVTEKEIQNDYLYNAKFLLKYKHNGNVIQWADFVILSKLIDDFLLTTPNELIKAASNDTIRQSELLYTLWYMVANNEICCDLNKKLTMNSELWCKI